MGNLNTIMPDFKASEIDTSNEYEPLPEGEYSVEIISAELKQTSAGGYMIEFYFQVLSGEKQGRKVVDRLNVVNKNSVAENIAKKSLAKICNAVNINIPKDTADFEGKKLKIKVAIKPGTGTYIDKEGVEKKELDKNEIKDYYAFNSVSKVEETQEKPWKEEESDSEDPFDF